MFKLPVCPYCDTVYRYSDVWKEIRRQSQMSKNREADNGCYHCHRCFKISWMPGGILLMILWIACSIGTNLLLLSRMTQLNIWLMMTATLLYFAVVIVICPFFVKFRTIEKKNNGSRKDLK